MPRRPNTVPSYLHHKPANQAYVRLPDGTGGRKVVYLGVFESPESRAEYARLVAELAARPTAVPPSECVKAPGERNLTVNEIFLAFWAHAAVYYRHPDGTPTSALDGFRAAIRTTRGLYGHTRAREFGPLALDAVRTRMVELGWARTTVNGRIGKLRLVFKWAASRELVPASVSEGLRTLAGLKKGRSTAEEPDPIVPVDDGTVRATLPHVRPEVAGMVRVQVLTGMRPGEVCRLRPCDIDSTGTVWVYRPPHHKTAHRGKARTVAIGPRAQAILTAFAPADPAGFYFSPWRQAERRHAERAAGRKTPRYPSHQRHNAARRKVTPKRAPGERYTTTAYQTAVRRGVEWANRRREQLAGAGNYDPVPHWHPNQLRHAHGTEVRRRYGLEAAQVALGHERADVTQVYAEKNLALAAKVAAEIG
ncbi:MAG TPA: site-specific integrase [Urbifossiella sp.]|nr:site-specific integrase [Urbifossiella sp.]